MTTGLAMKMRVELARLAVRHGITTPSPATLPLHAATDQPLCIEGIAVSANTVDHGRMAFAPCVFVLPLIKSRMPKLLYRHDPEQVAGEINQLSHDLDGNVRVRALVTHELAKRAPALSVAATVLAYELRDADSPNFYALITNAEIAEVSLTPSPANVHAQVTLRYPEPAVLRYYDLMADRVRCLIRQVEIIQQICSEQAAQPAPTPAPPRPTPPAKSPPKSRPAYRATDFGKLVSAMEQMQ